MATATTGLKAFKIGAIAADGGMGTTLTAVGTTVKGSFKVTSSEAQIKDFFIEESPDAPFYSAVTEHPNLEIEGECYDVDPATAVKLMGGTSATATGVTTYTPPTTYNPLELSVEVTSVNGFKIQMVRVLITASFDITASSEELGKIKFKGKVLLPTKAATPAYTYSVGNP